MNRKEFEREAYIYTQEKMVHYSADQNEVIEMLAEFAEKVQENKIADIKANCDFAIEGRDVKIKSLEKQIEKMKRHCNCKHRDREGYCEVKRTYLIDLSYDVCDKWELED